MNTGFGFGEFNFLMVGLRWTVLLSLIAFVGGGVVGLLVALARTSDNAVLRRITAGYIAVFQGTPLLMQLFVVYFGLGLFGVQLPAWLAVRSSSFRPPSPTAFRRWSRAGSTSCSRPWACIRTAPR